MSNPPNNNIGIFITNKQLQIQSWDSWLTSVSGLSVENVLGQTIPEIIPDLEERGLLKRFNQVLELGTVEVISATFHKYLIPTPPLKKESRFKHMRQKVTIAPLSNSSEITGLMVTIQDITETVERNMNLAEQLSSEVESERLQAIKQIAQQEFEEANQLLANAMGDSSWHVRKEAIRGLATREESLAINAIIHSLREHHTNPSILNSALELLALSNFDVVDSLTELIQDKSDVDLRIYTAHALGIQGDKRAIPVLIDVLKHDEDVNVKHHAMEALGMLNAKEALPLITEIALSGDFFLSFSAIDLLKKIGSHQTAVVLVPLLQNKMLLHPTAETLGELGDESTVKPLIELLNQENAPTTIITQSLIALYDKYQHLYQEGEHIANLSIKYIKEQGITNLQEALQYSKASELKSLIICIGWLANTELVSPLTNLLEKEEIRGNVIEALVRYGHPITGQLIKHLQNSSNSESRQATVLILGRIGDKRATIPLAKLLKDPDINPSIVAESLAKIGDSAAFDYLVQLLGHKNIIVRQSVIAALHSLGHPDMPQRIQPFIQDPNPLIRESAVTIAGYFGYPECFDLLMAACTDPEERVQIAALENLPYFGQDKMIVQILYRALNEGSPKIRAAVVRALAHLYYIPRVTELLSSCLEDTDMWVRYFAARSLSKLPYNHQILLNLIFHSEKDVALPVRISAIQALGEIGHEQAIPALTALINDENLDLVETTIRSLGKIHHPSAQLPLLKLIRSQDNQRKSVAMRALGEKSAPGSSGALQWAISMESDINIITEAIKALGKQETAESVAILLSLTLNPEYEPIVVDTLANSYTKNQLLWLKNGLTHKEIEIRQTVIKILERIKQPEAIDLLLVALQDSNELVQLSAIEALSYRKHYKVKRLLAQLVYDNPNPRIQKAVQEVLH